MAADGTAIGALQISGVGIADRCVFSNNADLGAHFTGGIGGGDHVYYGCRFIGSLSLSSSGGVAITEKFYECTLSANITIGNLTSLVWVGGEISTGGGTLTVSGSGAANVSAHINGNVVLSATGSTAQVIANTGAVGGNVTVTATSAQITVDGVWSAVSFSGAHTTQWAFRGTAADLDFTGPGEIQATIGAGSNPHRCVLRGTNVTGFVSVQAYTVPALKFIACVHSNLFADVADIGAGSQAYTFDASSHNNILVLGGSRSSGFTTPSTDLGYSNRVITEDADTFVTKLMNSGALMGPPGQDGEPGEQGPPGMTGATGAAGAAGAAGATGATGAAGAAGAAGTSGTSGEDGEPGEQGPPGRDGVALPESIYTGGGYTFVLESYKSIGRVRLIGSKIGVAANDSYLDLIPSTGTVTLHAGSDMVVEAANGMTIQQTGTGGVLTISGAKTSAIAVNIKGTGGGGVCLQDTSGAALVEVRSQGGGLTLQGTSNDTVRLASGTNGTVSISSTTTKRVKIQNVAIEPTGGKVNSMLMQDVNGDFTVAQIEQLKTLINLYAPPYYGDDDGVQGEQGPPGPDRFTGTTAAGDLAGTYPSPTIKSSVALSGSPTATTQATADNSTKVATTAYADRGASGTGPDWTAYTPILLQSSAVAKTVNSARFKLIGKTMHVQIDLAATAAGTATAPIQITLPGLADSANGWSPVQQTAYLSPLGYGVCTFNSTAYLVTAAFAQIASSVPYVLLFPPITGVPTLGQSGGYTAAIASGNLFVLNLVYEVS